jgi:uncharacterized repeat protein (TIGR03803 family)
VPTEPTVSVKAAGGHVPIGGLFQATDGSLYGATSGGGTSNFGTIFRLAVGLGPFVETLPAFSKAGRALYILGTKFDRSDWRQF